MPLNLGCNRLGVEKGGKYIREYGLNEIFKQHSIHDCGDIPCPSISNDIHEVDRMKNINDILYSNNLLADKVLNTLQKGSFPLIFGGDHSLTWGSLSGISKHYGTDIGCVYMDAHGDFNAPETSPSGNVHGMHMYYLMGFGSNKYVDFYNPGLKIKHQNVFFLGTRSLDYGEQILAQKHNFNIFSSTKIKHIGVEQTFNLLNLALSSLSHIHISLDIDSIDPVFAPGTGVPEPNGLTVEEVEYLLIKLLGTGKITSIDLVEFNPFLDTYNRTMNICLKLLKCIDNNLC